MTHSLLPHRVLGLSVKRWRPMGRVLGNEEPPPPLPQPWTGVGAEGAEVLMAVPWEQTSLGGPRPCLGTQTPATGRSSTAPTPGSGQNLGLGSDFSQPRVTAGVGGECGQPVVGGGIQKRWLVRPLQCSMHLEGREHQGYRGCLFGYP